MGNKLSAEELVVIVENIIECNGTEEELNKMIEVLEDNIVDPNLTDLIYYNTDNLAAKEIINISLGYNVLKL